MPFIQVVEYTTSRFEEGERLIDEYRAQMADQYKPRRVTVCKDRDRESHYVTIVEFDSYDDAMANSRHPNTDAMAKRLAELADGPPRFYNLDVVRAM